MTTTAELPTLSFSRVTAFDECPEKYKKRFIDKIDEASPSEVLERGKAAHAFCQDYVQHCRQKSIQTDISAVPEIVRAACQREKARESVWGEVWDIATTYAETHLIPLDGEMYVEAKFGGVAEGQEFFGFLDQVHVVDGVVTVTDWKSNWQIASQASVDGDRQLSIYALLAWLAFGQPDEVHVELDFIRYGAVRTSVRTRGQIEATAKYLIERGEAIQNETEFTGQVGAACTWCPYTYACEAFEVATQRHIAPPVDAVCAELLAQTQVALETQLGEVKARMKTYCSKNGPVETNGVRVGFTSSTSYSYPLALFLPILQNSGLKMVDYVKAATDPVKKLLKGVLRGELEAIRVGKKKTTFKARAIK